MKKLVKLNPTGQQKSFGSKAHWYEREDGVRVLISYTTAVAAVSGGVLYRLWDDYSATTLRHVDAFADMCGVSFKGNKAAWEAMPVVALCDVSKIAA